MAVHTASWFWANHAPCIAGLVQYQHGHCINVTNADADACGVQGWGTSCAR